MYFSNHVVKGAYRQKDNENVIDWGFFLSVLLSTLVSKILVFEKYYMIDIDKKQRKYSIMYEREKKRIFSHYT